MEFLKYVFGWYHSSTPLEWTIVPWIKQQIKSIKDYGMAGWLYLSVVINYHNLGYYFVLSVNNFLTLCISGSNANKIIKPYSQQVYFLQGLHVLKLIYLSKENNLRIVLASSFNWYSYYKLVGLLIMKATDWLTVHALLLRFL